MIVQNHTKTNSKSGLILTPDKYFLTQIFLTPNMFNTKPKNIFQKAEFQKQKNFKAFVLTIL